MIEGGKIVYASEESVLRQWEPGNSIFNALLIATLTTLLSYQAAAAIFDVLLGIKPRRQAPISDLQSTLLVHQSSPLTVADNLSRNDLLTVRRFHLQKHEWRRIPRHSERIRKRVAFKLLAMLAVAPLMNIASIILTVENDTVLSFNEARFGGMALGVEESLTSLPTVPMTDNCALTPMTLATGEEPLAEFGICSIFRALESDEPVPDNRAEVQVYTIGNITMTARVYLGSRNAVYAVGGHLHAGDAFFVQLDITKKVVNTLINYGMERWAEECGMRNADDAVDVTEEVNANRDQPVLMQKRMNCTTLPDEGSLERVATEIAKRITFVNSNELRLVSPQHWWELQQEDVFVIPPYEKADDFPLLKRRRRNFSLSYLIILTASVAAVRFFCALVCRNDIDLGLEMIAKRRLGFECCDSILWSSGSMVSYNTRDAPGKVAYIETLRDGLEPEVFPEGSYTDDLDKT